MKIEFKDVIIIILICIIIYALVDKRKDHFTEYTYTPLEQQINNAFEVDMSGIRKLNEIIVDLENNDLTTIDFNKYNVKELILNNVDVKLNSDYSNNFVVTNMKLLGDVIIKDHSKANIIPRGFIMAWYDEKIPFGWILCDGKTFWSHKYDSSDTLIKPITNLNNYYEIKTPDLKERFILGADNNINTMGGEKEVKLTYDTMPQHTHNGTKMMFKKGNNFSDGKFSGSCYSDYNFTITASTKYPVEYTDDKKNELAYDVYELSYDGDSSDEEDIMAARDIFPDNPGKIESNGGTTYFQEPIPILDKNDNKKIIGYDYLHTDMPHNNMPPFHCVYYIMKK
jgi:hypothetical protein